MPDLLTPDALADALRAVGDDQEPLTAAREVIARCGGAASFLALAARHRWLELVAAEVASEVCAKPPELALAIALRAMEEVADER